MLRLFTLLLVLSFLAGESHAQTCDPNQSVIRIDHLHYQAPDGRTIEQFFANLEQGTPVAERPPYVWRMDSGGWYWSCLPSVAEAVSEPDGWGTGQLVVGRYYKNPYYQIALLSAKDATIPGQPGRFRVFIYVSPGVYCGNVGWSLDTDDPIRDQVWKEVPEAPIVPGCHPATTVFPEWADPRRVAGVMIGGAR